MNPEIWVNHAVVIVSEKVLVWYMHILGGIYTYLFRDITAMISPFQQQFIIHVHFLCLSQVKLTNRCFQLKLNLILLLKSMLILLEHTTHNMSFLPASGLMHQNTST